MRAKKRAPQLLLMILGGLMMTSLAACSLTKNNRTWIEQNRVSDIYKVYPTKDPEDLFKVFPDGFDIEQSYIDEKGRAFRIYLEGNPDSKVISGEMVQNPNVKGTKKVADVTYEKEHFVFTNKTTDFNWPLDNFLFQDFTINEKFISELTEKKHGYNSQNGSFYMDYELDDPKIKSLFDLTNTKITNFGISGNGENYFVRTISFDFSNDTSFTETIERKN